MFILDASTSVKSDNFEKMKEFVKGFLSEADIDGGAVRVGVAMYSTGSKIMFDLNSYTNKEDVFDAIDSIYFWKGGTNTAKALEIIRTRMFTVSKGDRLNVDNVAIILTDGKSTIKKERTIPNADRARNQEIHIYSIGIGLQQTKELQKIANEPADENMFALSDFEALEGLEKELFSLVCGETFRFVYFY